MKNAESESEVTPKWPGLEKVHVVTDEEIDCHNKYIDNLIAMEIKNEKREMLLYLDELLEMTEKEVIKDVYLKQPVPEEIVVRINNDEFVNGEVVEKYISMKFLNEQGQYSFRQTQSHFVEMYCGSVLYYKKFSVTNLSQMLFFENSKICCVQDNLQKHGGSWVSIS